MERLAESSADRHRFANAFHLRGQSRIGFRKFLERKAGDFGDDVIDRGFKAGFGFTGNVVGQFPQLVTHSQFGRDFRDRKTGRLRRQSAGSADARVHLDHDHAAVIGMDRELDIGTARLDTDLADYRNTGVTHPLVFFVGQRLSRCDRNRIARVYAHWIKVLDGANDDDIVIEVTHDLHLVFFPANDRLFNEHLSYG